MGAKHIFFLYLACILIVFKDTCDKMSPMTTLYGIPNCDTVKKARVWLAAQGLAHTFHDLKKQGVPGDKLAFWAADIGWDRLLNRSGTTWRKLNAAEQAASSTAVGALALVLANPSLIKRPVVEWNTGALNAVTAGFDAAVWAANIQNAAKSTN